MFSAPFTDDLRNADQHDTADDQSRTDQIEDVGFRGGEEILQDQGEDDVRRAEQRENCRMFAFDRFLRQNAADDRDDANQRRQTVTPVENRVPRERHRAERDLVNLIDDQSGEHRRRELEIQNTRLDVLRRRDQLFEEQNVGRRRQCASKGHGQAEETKCCVHMTHRTQFAAEEKTRLRDENDPDQRHWQCD